MSEEIVYFIRCGEFVKIGTTKNIGQRIKDLQSSNPHKLHLEHTLEGNHYLEAELHFENHDKRIHGEWFRLNQEEVDKIVFNHFCCNPGEYSPDIFLDEIRDIMNSHNKNGFLSATQAVKSCNRLRAFLGVPFFNLSQWLESKELHELLKSFEEKLITECLPPFIIKGRGKGKHTWVHPFVFFDLVLNSVPPSKAKVKLYEQWFFGLPFEKQS